MGFEVSRDPQKSGKGGSEERYLVADPQLIAEAVMRCLFEGNRKNTCSELKKYDQTTSRGDGHLGSAPFGRPRHAVGRSAGGSTPPDQERTTADRAKKQRAGKVELFEISKIIGANVLDSEHPLDRFDSDVVVATTVSFCCKSSGSGEWNKKGPTRELRPTRTLLSSCLALGRGTHK